MISARTFPSPSANYPEWEAAQFYLAAGVSVIPVRADGSKAPLLDGWREFADVFPPRKLVWRWFMVPGLRGVGLPAGPASGVYFFDFEDRIVYDRWWALIPSRPAALVKASPAVATPGGGVHVYARTIGPPPPGKVFARHPNGEVRIETRGDGHQVVAPGSPPWCHPDQRPYRFVRLGWLAGGPVARWSPTDLAEAHAAMAALDESPAPAYVPMTTWNIAVIGGKNEGRPGDDLNHRGDWPSILCPFGWRVSRTSGSTTFWTRPGKSPAAGPSATTGYCTGPDGDDRLHVFSSNAYPLVAGETYSKFDCFTRLNCRGDYRRAAGRLAAQGYGS